MALKSLIYDLAFKADPAAELSRYGDLSNADLNDLGDLFIRRLWDENCRLAVERLSKLCGTAKVSSGGRSAEGGSARPRIKYFFTKLFKINELLHALGLEDEFQKERGGESFKNDYGIALWYLLRRAKIVEINGFIEFFSRHGKKRDAVKMLVEESSAAFDRVFGGCENKIALQKLKFFYKDISESSHGQKRRDAEYKYYIIDEYITGAGARWAFFIENAGDGALLYDALKHRFDAVTAEQSENEELRNKFDLSGAYILKKAEACFGPDACAEFAAFFSDKNHIERAFRAACKSRTGEIFQKYISEISFERFEKNLDVAVNGIVYKFVEVCCSELNAAEYHIGEKLLSEMILHCFTDAAGRAAAMLGDEVCRWIDEGVINAQIADRDLKAVNKLVLFNSDLGRTEETVTDDKLAGLASKYLSLHVVFSCRIDHNKKTVRELCRLITPTHDAANNRMIYHCDFAPLEIPYAKGVILKDGAFEYDKFNTWFGGRDKIHRSELNSPYSGAIIHRMAEDINSILSKK